MKKFQTKSVLAILLCLLMVVTLFAGCKPGDPKETTAGPTGTTTAGGGGGETTLPPESTKPPVDLTGFELRLGGMFILKFAPDIMKLVGLDNTAKFDRLQDDLDKMQEEHGFTLTWVFIDPSIEAVTQAVMSGGDMADFVFQRNRDFYLHAANNRLKPLDGDELKNAGLNIWDETKYDKVFTEMSEFGGNIWALSTNGEYYVPAFGRCIAFNPKLTAQHGYDAATIYNLVREKKWTVEKFLEIAAACTVDTDNDGTPNTYGTGGISVADLIHANNYTPIYKNDAGKWVANFDDPKCLSAMTIAQQVNDVLTVASPAGTGKDGRQSFVEGKIAFQVGYGWNFNEDPYNQSSFAYGIVPIPMLPNATEYTCLVPDLDAWTMLSTRSAEGLDKAVAAMDLWADLMTDDMWEYDVQNNFFRDKASWEIFSTYIYPAQRLSMFNITKEINNYISDNIFDLLLEEGVAPAVAVEGASDAINGMLNDSLNK